MAYTNFTNCTANQYNEIIYSQEDKNRIRIWFNNVELEDAGEYCESLTGTNRILPNDGKNIFSLDNFISKEYTLTLRDLPNNVIIADQVKISIGTLVDSNNNTYEDVPIGVFNIQDTPTTDSNKISIKLRDNRVKFDFNYNAQPLIESLGGSATLGQILNNICFLANVTNNVGNFDGDNIEVSIYDNSISATTYVSYILEQGGYIPTIDRYGNLIKIDISNLTTHRIPLSLVEKYEIGTPYEIERVVYESGIIKYESSNNEALDTLYLNSANPYITEQEQIDNIFEKLEGFVIDSVVTGRILGNPAIDSYDLIEIYDDEQLNEPTVFKTLANNAYTFNGVHRNTFDTQIGKEQRTENVSLNSEPTFRKYAKTSIDNLENSISLTVGEINDLGDAIEETSLELTKQSARIDVATTNINPETGDVLELKRTGYELGANGLIIDDEQGYKSVSNTTGTYYYDNDNMIGKYTKDGSVQKDMALFGKYYYGIDEEVNVETFTKDDAMFIAQMYTAQWTDKNGVSHSEEGFGHFFNN